MKMKPEQRLMQLLDQAIACLREAQQRNDFNPERTSLMCAGLKRVDAAAQGEPIKVYWAGSAGLARLASELSHDASQQRGAFSRVDKIGTSIGDVTDRLKVLGSDEYAACFYDADGKLRKDAGFSAWVMQAIHVTRGSIDPDVLVRTRSLNVTLPQGMSRRLFDRRLHDALSKWSYAKCFPGRTRFTMYSIGGGTNQADSKLRGVTRLSGDRLSEAQELYVGLDPRRDGNRLLGIVETIVAEHRAAHRSGSTQKTAARIKVTPDRLTTDRPAKKATGHRTMSAAQIVAMRARKRMTAPR